MLLLSCGVPAQQETLDENPAELPNEMSGDLSGALPGMEHLAAALSHEASRLETLLTMVVADHLLEVPVAPGQVGSPLAG